MAANQIIAEIPVALPASVRLLLLCALALQLGVAGDLASCGRIPLPVFLAPSLIGFYYVAIVLAAIRFGDHIGVAAAVLVGVVHVTVGMVVCAQSISQQSEVATFIVVGLLTRLLTRYVPERTHPRHAQPDLAAPGQHVQGEGSWKVDVGRSGHISPGFIQAVRTPLAAIESAGYLLEEAALTGENHREVTAIILKECHRLAVLTRSLEFIQPRPPAYREVKLSSLIDEIARLASPLTEPMSIKLQRADGPDLRLVCDPDLIEQAVLNLITNVLQFVGQGEEVVLSAQTNKGDGMIKISHPRVGVLAHIRIPMAVMPEGQFLGHSPELGKPSSSKSGIE